MMLNLSSLLIVVALFAVIAAVLGRAPLWLAVLLLCLGLLIGRVPLY